MTDLARQRFSMEDQEWVDRFLAQTTLFLRVGAPLSGGHAFWLGIRVRRRYPNESDRRGARR